MKIFWQIFLGILLIALFLVTYSLVSLIKPSSLPEGFSNKPQVIGQEGGFHLLNDIKILRYDKYDTVAIYTNLNRSSAAEGVETPATSMAIGTADDQTPTLKISLTDSKMSDELSPADISRISRQLVPKSPIEEVIVTNPKNPDMQQIEIRLTKGSQYRLGADTKNAGTILVDILK
jgi:hypothetical protein